MAFDNLDALTRLANAAEALDDRLSPGDRDLTRSEARSLRDLVRSLSLLADLYGPD